MLNLPGYHITEQIYESANTLVYRAHRDADDQAVIIKFLKEDYPSPQELVRYRQEYAMTSALEVEGMIHSYNLERYQNTFAIIFEDFGADSLTILRNTGKLSLHVEQLESFLNIALQIAEMLGKIHEANIIHKDINSSNIVLNPANGKLKIIDFGISTRLPRENPVISDPEVLEGTLAYISPEQSGRMNRNLDYRTDFYSLGVTLYELLTNSLPFTSDDPLELVHYHIAKRPVPPRERNRNIPHPVSDIIMKLLAKNAEDRYQSAYGLKADITYCLANLPHLRKIEDFRLGQDDFTGSFQPSQKLYGRDSEIEILLQAFERVSTGVAELVLITGLSGVGKTALVHEVHKPMTRKRGNFISGKFDQFQRNIPYYVFSQAFNQFCNQILTEDAAGLSAWQTKILQAVGDNGQILIDIIPALQQVIGRQPAAFQVGAQEAQNRLNFYITRFIHAMSGVDHPLILFIDDLQWADAASLNLLKLILTDTQNQHLLVIGAYRDNEVTTGHPLRLTLDEIEKVATTISRIPVQNLSYDDVANLTADSLSCDLSISRSLSKLVHDKTVGNAFFVNQFLQSLVEDELLTFMPPLPQDDRERKDKERGGWGWTWNVAQIQAKGVTDNVVDLMEGKIGKLAPATQQVLRLAACVGNTFDLKTLSIIDERPLGETLKNVLAGVAEGLLFPLDDHYKQMAVFEDSVLSTKRTLANDSEPERAVFKFVHDRVQQAAYAMIEPGQRDEIHLNIGRLLLANTSREALADKLFDIVNQLNHGTALISDRSEKSRLAELNLKAGQAAKLATAYDSALNYLNRGLGLLTEDSWQREYELTLELYVGAVQTARMSGKFEQMEHYADAVLLNARTLLDQMAIYESKMRAKTAQSQQGQAIKFALQGLRQLGLTLPENPSEEDVRQGFEQLQPLLAGKSIPDLIDLPPMTDPIQLAAMQIMMTAMPPAYQTNPGLMLLLDFKQIELSIKYGNTSVSLYSYATYGYILCSNYDDIDTGYQFGRLALNLLNKLDDNAMKCKIAQLYYTFVAHWKAHARETIQPLLDGYQSGLETGDIEYLTYCAQVYSCNLYLIGYDLVTVEQESAAFAQVFTRLKQSNILILQRIYWQAALNLLGQSSDPCLLVGQVFDEKIRLPQLKQSNNSLSLFMTYYNKLLLSYLFQDYRQARTNAEQAAKYAHGNPGALGVVIFNLYDSLSLLAVCPDTPETEQNGILERVAANQERMKYWADHAPMNYLHKFYLVEAERARVLGQDAAAGEYYDQAIELAKEHEYINEEALAYELAGKFYLAKGRTRLAGFYLCDAHYAYRRWGAIAKVKDVEQRYEAVLVGAWQQLQRPTVTTVSTSTGETARLLDIQTLVKASHTLSGEIVLPRLLEKMMRVMIENAGAENGFLLLPGRDCWCIEAEGALNQAEVRVLQSIPLETASGQHKIPQISEAIVNYVIRTRESLVLNDAVHEGRFSHDAYVVKRQPKSVLCIPLLNQGHLTGLLYLENNLTTGAFTSERLELLKLLSSQAAVSIENARLYANLQSSEKKYRAIFEESKDLIFISTTDGQIIDANPACETLLGFTRSEFLQLNTLAVYARRADRTRFRKAMAHQGAVKDFEVRLRHKEGHEIESLVTATVRQSEDGNILGYQGIVRDITAQKEAARERLHALESRHAKEAAEAATRAKSSFLANMSHELRTPLNTIIGFTRLVARRCEDVLPQIQHENLGKVLISADHLLMLINSILDLSKIESGHMEVLRTEVTLPPLIDLCTVTVEPIAESKNLRLIKQVDANLPVLQTDIDKLKQILINFLSNAVKFTHEGSITIRVKQSGSNTIDFSVADTGIGVPEDALEKIFEEFRQVDDDRARKYGGTGLGLAITQRLARLLGGEVRVESTIGVGSTFTLILPVN